MGETEGLSGNSGDVAGWRLRKISWGLKLWKTWCKLKIVL